MTKVIFLFAFFCVVNNIKAQNVGIGTTTPNANAALEIKSNNKGVLMPRLSTTARNNMTNVAKGMLVYDTTNAGFYYHDGGKWQPISQLNSDSSLTYTYPGIAPVITNMSLNQFLVTYGSYGTLYDNGGAAGNYVGNSNDLYTIQSRDTAVLIMVEVEEMNLESPYDTLEIFSFFHYQQKQLFTGNRTGTFYFSGDEDLVFRFRSNGVNNLPGFKINWTKLTPNLKKAESTPLTGWYFNSGKIAARGGVNVNNNWATDSLGMYSFAFGQNAIARGDNSVAFGKNSTASGKYSLAMGENIASGDFSTAIGLANKVTGTRSSAVGFGNEVRGHSSVVIGTGLINKATESYAVGNFNDTAGTNKIFEIGRGVSNLIRENALTILNNGNTGIGTVTPTTTLDVDGGIRTKYSGSVIKSVTGNGSAALVNLTIPALPTGWDFTNTLVLVSVADGISGIMYSTKLTATNNIQLFFEANATGPTRFNYIVFKL